MTLRTLLTLSALSMGLACGSSSTTAPTATAFIGTYTLTHINGTALPTSLVQGTTTSQVTAGTAQITNSNTWTATFTATPSNVTLSGTYTVSSNGLNLVQTVGGQSTNTATITNNVMTVTIPGTPAVTFTYTKN